jgi:DNA-directed RNA polymerase subunit beta'
MKGSTSFGAISIQLASSELVKNLSYGEVKKPETINYRTLRPEREGLFCEKIFGPTKDFECSCGKFRSIRYKGIVCDKCGVEVTEAKVRRYRTGHIELAAPVAHIWYYRIVPSKIALLLEVTPADIQSILYFEKYIVIDPGETDLVANQVLTDEEFEEYREKYKEAFSADTGAVAIKKILKNLDLDELIDQLRNLVETKPKVDKKVLKRLELAEEIRKSHNKPEWVILDIIPVIPPDLRPMVPLDGGRFATSDINDLYRRLINRNNRLKKLKSVNAPDIIIKNEMRMVQDAVDSLFDNSRRSHPVTGNGDRPLKSLSDILKGKQGRFRQNLLGKRVDYSGRSVIIVGPNLKLHQCGLPKLMALELFKPFVMRGLVEQGYAHNIKAAKRMIETEHELVWGILENVVKDHPVLLNRAPTLHRLGIQAFEPILIEEKAIQLHPLVCHSYNADFDGDQMAVHVPLTPEAQIEAWVLMLSSRNLLNPANGKPIVYPTQDMVLGIYYLTKVENKKPEKYRYFDDIHELILGIEHRKLSYNQRIMYRLPENYIEQMKKQIPAEQWKGLKSHGSWVETTPGRVIFNEIIPEKLKFVNDALTSKKIEPLIASCYKVYGIKETAKLVDDLKNIGFKYSTIFGVTISLADVEIPNEKNEIVEKTEKEVEKTEENARKGLITHDEKYNQVVDLWASTNEKIKKLVEKKLQESEDGFNPLYAMMDSGARGSREQIRQLAGMRGLMAKPSGEIIELAIKSNFKEGLSVLEYFISSHGARKGLADTALKTADAGYLTRKLVDVSQDVVINEPDCETVKGIEITAIKEGDEIIKQLRDRILGHTSVSNIYDPRNGNLIISANQIFDEEKVKMVEDAGIEQVMIRSVLTCESSHGVCAACYGWDLSSRKLVNIGEAVGIIAAESIGQPGTQLTMRTFHIGGTAATQLEESELKLNYDCFVVEVPENLIIREVEGKTEMITPRKSYVKVRKVIRIISAEEIAVKSLKSLDNKEFNSEEVLFKTKSGDEVRFGKKIVVKIYDESVLILENNINDYSVRVGSTFHVNKDKLVRKGNVIADFDPYNEVFITEHDGILSYAREKVDGNEEKNKNLLVILSDQGEELERFVIVHGTVLAFPEGSNVKRGDIIARRPMAKRRTRDIIGGLPRVTELFESRKPKNIAVISKVGGIVDNIEQKKGKYLIIVRAKNGVTFSHVVPTGKNIFVRIGDKVEAGEQICDGVVSSHDILKVKGYTKVNEFLLNEIQGVYRLQGVDINEKHISVIIRQMLRKVEVVNPGDTEFISGQNVDKIRFYKENDKIIQQGGQPAKARPILMGLTKASLFTESFLSAASFQETPRVLSSAALKSARDTLDGLKENIVIGQLIPAGTGIKHYQSIKVKVNE